jgi:hypothetical protein
MEYGIIADLSAVNPMTLKDFAIIGLALISGAVGLKALFGKNTTALTPDPLRIEKLDKFATRDWCERERDETKRRLDSHDKDIAKIHDEFRQDREKNEVHASQRSQTIFRAIDELRRELTEKIDSTPERLIDTLTKLGKL